ncbi:MAG: cytochrome b/b6 domain-containing protein [Betaproteobacteria bacterium]|uniref:Cytochrome b/b6 domain-containing protein n=1 Tax=Candidatus Proximibacter danicus TaxID=2954365 RepID=A0A9D7K0L4_9PROT|nr:cytochrome b/b6 domain-containing protein [Candidatus Proximibacter danicus]
MSLQKIRIWDLPTRVFHWSLVVLVVALIVSGKIGGNFMDWHGKFGLAVVGLLCFRLVWGVLGSTYARFASFFPTPARLRAYLRGEWKEPGHNPLGALSVFALLGLLGLQVATGLASNDDIAFRGPLFELAGKALSDRLTGIHKLSINVLFALIVLHIAAILFYVHVRKDNLFKPMITGWKQLPQARPASGGGITAFVIALTLAAAAVHGASGAWLPPPPPPATIQTPAW